MDNGETSQADLSRQKLIDALRDLCRQLSAAANESGRAEPLQLIGECLRLLHAGEHGESTLSVWARPPDPGALRNSFADLPQTNFRDVPDFHFPVERNMPRHADIATIRFPALADIAGSTAHPARPLKVCIVTFEFDGPTRPEGPALEYRRLAQLLSAAGHKVTVLYMRGEDCDSGPVGKWIARYAAEGIDLVPLPPPELPSIPGLIPSVTTPSRAAYEWLRNQSFDVVHSTAARGCIHAAVTAKHLGIDFADTLFAVEAWPPTLWTLIAGGQSTDSLRQLAIAYMERKSVELADIVISPSRHMFRWMMRHGYDLPKARCFVHPGVLAEPVSTPANGPRGPKRIGELVFVGSFDVRKGIGAFQRALDGLGGGTLRGMTVTYIGEASPDFSLKHELMKSQSALPFEVQVLDYAGIDETVSYLCGEGRMAVMPSLLDGSPQILAACLNKGIPVLVSQDGGAQDMILEDDWPAAVCASAPADLAARIEAIIRDGAVAARPAIDAKTCRDVWTSAHRALADPAIRQRHGGRHRTWNGVAPALEDAERNPLVSVCIVHFNRPAELAQAVESVRQQSYRNIEIVVVDDGSTLPAAKAYLDRLDQELTETRSGRIVRQANRYLGAARNAGIRNSTGAFILMMDDDDLARPDEVETLAGAATFAGVDILCSYADTFTGPGLPSDGRQYHQRVAGLGDAVSLGLFVNCLGGSRCLIRRRVFDALGGFTEDYGVGLDDHEFAMRAVLRGFKLMVLPRALYWYRASPQRLRDMHFDRLSGMTRVFNAVLDNAPLCVTEALRFAQTLGRPDIAGARRDRGIVHAIRNGIARIRSARMIRRS